MLTWVLLLLIVGGFYSLIVPALAQVWAIVAGLAYGVLASSTVLAGILACFKDPIDPNVRRFHQVRLIHRLLFAPRASGRRSKGLSPVVAHVQRSFFIRINANFPHLTLLFLSCWWVARLFRNVHGQSRRVWRTDLTRAKLRRGRRQTKLSASFASCT